MKYLVLLALVVAALPNCGGTTDAPMATDAAVAADADVAADTAQTDAMQEVATEDIAPAVGAGPLLLQPGEVAEFVVTDGTTVAQVRTPLGTEKFVVILASTRFDNPAKTYAYTAELDVSQSPSSGTVVQGCALSLAWKNQVLPEETPPFGVAAKLGDKRKLHMGSKSISATIMAVGKLGVVWVDDTTPVDAAVITEFLKDFDDLILPRERTIFGMESDLDNDGHINLVFSPVTYETSVAYFTGCDLLPQVGCGDGNQGEFLYLTPPTAIKPPYNTPAAIKETLAHELGHLIHFNRKVLRNNLQSWDDSSYMIEGAGGFTQDVSGFQAGNLYVAMAGLDGINDFSLASTLKDKTAYDMAKDGVLRGGSYWFVRYLYDRAGGDEAKPDGTLVSKGGPVLLHKLLESKASIAKTLPDIALQPIADIAVDFYTALAASNREEIGEALAQNSCFRFLPTALDPITGKQRGGNVYAKFHGIGMKGPASLPLAKADKKIRAGGVKYWQVNATADAPSLQVLVNADADAQVRLRVLRVK